MQHYYLIAVAAGLTSGLLQAAVAIPAMGGLMLAYLAPLPLFLAGLGVGVPAAAIAMVVAGVLAVMFAGPGFAAVQFLAYGLPILIICRQALLSRNDANGQQIWYPPGQLILWQAGIAIAGLLLATVGLALFDNGLVAYAQSVLEPFAAGFPTPEQREALLTLVDYVPAFLVFSWSMGLLINGVLAQGLLVRFGYNLRPSPKLAGIRLPAVWIGVLLLSLFLASLDGLFGMLGKTLAAIAIVPYFLLGLGVVHRLLSRVRARVILLILFYGLLLLWPLPVLVAGLGLLNAVLQLRSGKDLDDIGGKADKEE